MRLAFYFTFLLFLSYSFFSSAESKNFCKEIFSHHPSNLKYSKLYYEEQALKRDQRNGKNKHPEYTHVERDYQRVKLWDEKDERFIDSRILNFLLPDNTFVINHQLDRPGNQTTVKLGEPGSAVIVRANYEYGGYNLATNVTFSNRALAKNMEETEQKWLVGRDAKAAILYLHGGGTKSTGSHVANAMISHFKNYDIDVLAPDLPWHANGHREFIPSFETEINILSAFSKKYIPPNVPLFVWGHSWGAVFAEKLMTMTDRENFSFHPSLKGVIILSPPVDAAPGKPINEKFNAYYKRIDHAKQNLTHEFADSEMYLSKDMVAAGKISPLGSLYSMHTMLQMNQIIPTHKGSKYIPALMVVGESDPLVYVGFGDLFKKYYDKLENVDVHYLRKLPLLINGVNEDTKRVGHMLGDYIDPNSREPIHSHLGQKFMSRVMNVPIGKVNIPLIHPLVRITQLHANDLAFREFINYHIHISVNTISTYKQLFAQNLTQIRQNIQHILNRALSRKMQLHELLSQLTEIKTEQELDSITEKLDLLLKTNELLSHKDLRKDLFELQNDLSVEKMSFVAQKLLNKYEKILRKTPKRIEKIVNSILKAGSILNAIKILHNQAVPYEVKNQIKKSLLQYFKFQEISEGTYAPRLKDLLEEFHLEQPEQIKMIKRQLNEIRSIVHSRKELKRKIRALSKEQKTLSAEYNNLVELVRKKIRLIKLVIEKASSEPPKSLLQSYENSKKELESLQNLSDSMTNVIEKLSFNFIDKKTNASIEEINNSVNQKREKMDQFSELYSQYMKNRTALRAQLLRVVEKGGMGDESREAVVAIYGDKSNGYYPTKGTKSIYLDLQKKMTKLAEKEDMFYKVKIKHGHLILEYQDLYMKLFKQLTPKNDNKYTKAMTIANQVVSVKFQNLKEILSLKNPNIWATIEKRPQHEQREYILSYIQTHEKLFQEVINLWNRLNSSLPPLLPHEAM